MGVLNLEYKDLLLGRRELAYALPNSEFRRFNPSILDLGDISAGGEDIEALAAVFDLEAFTSFCNQIDPHLVIPDYMSKFLDWLFRSISVEFTRKQKKGSRTTTLWCKLPFYAKFLGDGVLFLWDMRDFDLDVLGNIVDGLSCICENYTQAFLPHVKKSVSRAPAKLRCGIARGRVISIGAGRDFVGPCINVAARLQKLGQFSFAFSKRGFDLDKHFSEDCRKLFVLIKSPIRGVGDEEFMFVLEREFKRLSPGERKKLRP
jgi:class 3 adenylate cyclase